MHINWGGGELGGVGVFQNPNLEKSIITRAGTNLTVSALLLCHNRLKSKRDYLLNKALTSS